MAKFSIHRLFYGVVPLWSLWRNWELWHLINQAQKAYKHLKNLLGRDFRLECSWTLFVNGLLFIIFIILGVFKTIWLGYPTTKSELPQYGSYKLCNYILDISYCIFFVILALHLYYHILHACLCESLNGLILKNNQNLIKGLFQALPYLRRMNYIAGFYFNASYICLLLLICNRCIHFLELLKIDDTELLLENRKSLEDMEQEAEWAGQDWQMVESGNPLTEAAITLAWLLGIWILVLSAAGLQQIAHHKFAEKLSDLDFPFNAEELIVGSTSELNIEIWRAKNDILDLKVGINSQTKL
ncbi:uncharacterized protein LOC124460587 [Drosophila willistoni]|uniref:uncharacterized protein LOC124460587 n=1 Tax=Drosophila willistoni TaxID=7260 RepID=UPI001F0842EF|nr:uncharacterized protein LOC124460587 [Drosophila willistoni]